MSTDHAVAFSSPAMQEAHNAYWTDPERLRLLDQPTPGYPSLDPDLAELLAEIPWRF